MRTIRAFTASVALIAGLPGISAAQQGRPFTDAWFWGVKAGGFSFADTAGKYKLAPVGGVDWMITRTHGGLYVSASQAFLTQQSFIQRDPFTADSGTRVVDLKNVRKLDVAIVGFPGTHIRLHPYIGAGFTLSQIANAAGRGPFSSTDQSAFTDQTIRETKAGFSPLFLGGVQYRMPRFSVFGQALVTPAQTSFLLYNGKSFYSSFEVGIRYNAGSSIDRN